MLASAKLIPGLNGIIFTLSNQHIIKSAVLSPSAFPTPVQRVHVGRGRQAIVLDVA